MTGNGKMNKLSCTFCMFFVLAGCSADSIKRASYQTVQNLGQEQCQKQFSEDCRNRPGYDDYQRNRESLNNAQ